MRECLKEKRVILKAKVFIFTNSTDTVNINTFISIGSSAFDNISQSSFKVLSAGISFTY